MSGRTTATAIWDLSLFCPNRCHHCIAGSTRDIRCRLSRAVARRVLCRLIAGGVRFISIKLGEPFLQPDLIDIVREGNRRGAVFQIYCGGRGAREQKLRELASLTASNELVFSLDDDRALHNDRLRYKGSYRSVLRSLRFLEREKKRGCGGLVVGINHTVARTNWRRVRSFLDLAHKYHVDFVSIDELLDIGLARGKNLALSHDRLRKLKKRLRQLEKEYPFAIHYAPARDRRTPHCVQCPAKMEKGRLRGVVRVDHLGYVFPCNYLMGYEYTGRGAPMREARKKALSLVDVSLKKALASATFKELGQRLRKANRLRERFRPCKRCAWKTQCLICPFVLEDLVERGSQHCLPPCRLKITDM